MCSVEEEQQNVKYKMHEKKDTYSRSWTENESKRFHARILPSQPKSFCSNSTIETLEKGVTLFQS